MSHPRHQLEPREFNALAGIVAWVIPGGGHWFVLGDRTRGMAIMIGIFFLIVMGTLVGGVQSVDSKDQRLWFLAQACNGPVVLVIDAVNQNVVKTKPATERDPITAFGRVQELGILFIALAGLMNLVITIDALHHRPPGKGATEASTVPTRVAPSAAPKPPVSASPEPAGAAAPPPPDAPVPDQVAPRDDTSDDAHQDDGPIDQDDRGEQEKAP